MGAAARLVDAIAHRYAGGRWLATGGGGYDAYRVVPRMWAHVWLAGAHLPVPDSTPAAWRARWSEAASAFGRPGLPLSFDDSSDVGASTDTLQRTADATSRRTADEVLALIRRFPKV